MAVTRIWIRPCVVSISVVLFWVSVRVFALVRREEECDDPVGSEFSDRADDSDLRMALTNVRRGLGFVSSFLVLKKEEEDQEESSQGSSLVECFFPGPTSVTCSRSFFRCFTVCVQGFAGCYIPLTPRIHR